MPVSIHFSRLKAYMPQSKEVIKMLIADNKVSNREAEEIWFSSKTLEEIVDKKLTDMSADKAYSELKLERTNNPNWMKHISE